MTLLLIDDHMLFREGLVLLLQKIDPESVVFESATLEDGLDILQRADNVDLALLDLALPDRSGMDGIALIRERHPEVPVVILSASDDKSTVLQALDRGAVGYIPKSSSFNVMLGALRLVLSRGIYLPPSVFLGEERAAVRSTPGRSTPASGPMAPADLGLSERQVQVLYFILQGLPSKLIARELQLSLSTVRAHTTAILRCLNVTTRTQVVIAASRLGLRFDDSSGS
jgi:DNA-binding NarL/FixJ family response regulator